MIQRTSLVLRPRCAEGRELAAPVLSGVASRRLQRGRGLRANLRGPPATVPHPAAIPVTGRHAFSERALLGSTWQGTATPSPLRRACRACFRPPCALANFIGSPWLQCQGAAHREARPGRGGDDAGGFATGALPGAPARDLAPPALPGLLLGHLPGHAIRAEPFNARAPGLRRCVLPRPALHRPCHRSGHSRLTGNASHSIVGWSVFLVLPTGARQVL